MEQAARQSGSFRPWDRVLGLRDEAVLDAIRVRVDSEHLSCRIDAKDSGALTRLGTRHCQRIVHLLDGPVDSPQKANQRGGTRDGAANGVLYVTGDGSRRLDDRTAAQTLPHTTFKTPEQP